jgi:superfamily I DNA and/or RNA helicase
MYCLGCFSHILLDEAAQALEVKAIIPLCLATESTRVVLAGDPQQMNAEVFSNEVYDLDLHRSLLSRLVTLYPHDHPCRVVLRQNYRAHEAIVNFLSENFYGHQLIASGPQQVHDLFHPLTFCAVYGADVQLPTSTSFFNSAEVYTCTRNTAH